MGWYPPGFGIGGNQEFSETAPGAQSGAQSVALILVTPVAIKWVCADFPSRRRDINESLHTIFETSWVQIPR